MKRASPMADAMRALREHGGERMMRYENALAGSLLSKLVRAGGRLTPALDDLVAASVGTPAGAKILALVPEPRRGRAISRWVWKHTWKEVCATAVPLLHRFPSKALARALLADRDFVEDEDRPIAAMEKVANPDVQRELRVWQRKRARAEAQVRVVPKLVCSRLSRPKSLDDLTSIEKRQLGVMANGYDGKKLPLAARFGDGPDAHAYSLEIREIADERGKHAYDIFTWLADDGCAFKAGTTTEIANLVQHDVDCNDPALREALRAVMQARVRSSRRKPKCP